MPQDDELVRLAKEGIEALNRKYESQRSDIFFLFHRPRRWNAQEEVWMGYERKRGKLTEFNAFCHANSRSASSQFAEVVGDTTRSAGSSLTSSRSTRTRNCRAIRPGKWSARWPIRSIGRCSMRQGRRVVAGYGIMQPRVGVSLPSAQRSWFVRLFAGDAGLDPYTRVVSDLYQDVFGEGSFIGKGIYDVDAFEQCCDDFPENAILSHDLLESTYVRSALLSDVELYEEYPSRYPADVSRRHRWMRGDWQIARWLLPWVPNREGQARARTRSAPSGGGRFSTIFAAV